MIEYLEYLPDHLPTEIMYHLNPYGYFMLKSVFSENSKIGLTDDQYLHRYYDTSPFELLGKYGKIKEVNRYVYNWFLKNQEKIPKKYEYLVTNSSFPLLHATMFGHTEIVKMLLDNGFDVDIPDDVGYTPLYIASLYRRLDVVKLLLENHANPNHQDNYGSTAMTTAVRNGFIEIVRILLDHKADPNIQNIDGNTAMIEAVYSVHPDIVRLFLDYHADPDISNKDGNTALKLAFKVESLEIARILKKYTRDKNERQK
jgi:ankyrin repeat protein